MTKMRPHLLRVSPEAASATGVDASTATPPARVTTSDTAAITLGMLQRHLRRSTSRTLRPPSADTYLAGSPRDHHILLPRRRPGAGSVFGVANLRWMGEGERIAAVVLATALSWALPAPPAAAAHAAEAPIATRRNGRILSSQSHDALGSLRPDGSGYRLLASDSLGDAVWSPDKSLIAYTSVASESSEIHVMKADASDNRLIVEGSDEFSWSPDGNYLAYADRSDDPLAMCAAVWIIDVRTSSKRMVAEAPGCEANELTELAWSPSGTHVAFVDGRDQGGIEAELDIYSADVVTGELTRLTDAAGVDRDPSWSPDGSFIVFESSRDHSEDHRGDGGCFRRTEIYRMRHDGSRQKRLSGNVGNPDCNPSWSPDGGRMLWTTYLKKGSAGSRPFEVRVARRDGSSVVGMTDAYRRRSFGGDFSPNGRWIVFAIVAPEGSGWFFDLYKARPDGTDRTRLTRRGVHAGHPDW